MSDVSDTKCFTSLPSLILIFLTFYQFHSLCILSFISLLLSSTFRFHCSLYFTKNISSVLMEDKSYWQILSQVQRSFTCFECVHLQPRLQSMAKCKIKTFFDGHGGQNVFGSTHRIGLEIIFDAMLLIGRRDFLAKIFFLPQSGSGGVFRFFECGNTLPPTSLWIWTSDRELRQWGDHIVYRKVTESFVYFTRGGCRSNH